MRLPRFRSLKTALLFAAVILFLQLLIAGINLYLNWQKSSIQSHRNTFYFIEKQYLNRLATEAPRVVSDSHLGHLTEEYRKLSDHIRQSGIPLPVNLLEERITLNRKKHTYRTKQQEVHNRISEIMITLATSVSYIHEHHMAYLRNTIRYGSHPDTNPSSSFTKSSSQEGSELDKIESATSIQTNLLEVFAIFSLLERDSVPPVIQDMFDTAMTKLYGALDMFENYSLDAQDGLLVEELIVNGSVIERSFTELLNYKNALSLLKLDARKNKDDFLSALDMASSETEKRYSALLARLDFTVKSLIVLSALLLISLLLLGYRLMQTLSRSLTETHLIRNDLNHRIPEKQASFEEFELFFTTLNMVAATATSRMNELTAIQSELENRVAQRTTELHRKNIELETEIKNKEYQQLEQLRLEEKLSRAQKMEALGTLAGGVAHDLNNILSAIINYPELMLLDLPDDHKMRQPLLNIQNSGRKAAVIVQDLLTMARRGVAQQEPIDFNKLIFSFLESPEGKAIFSSYPGVSLETSLQENAGIMRGSKIHLQKTIMNLLTNAAESITNEGTVTIQTSAAYIDRPIGNYDHVKEGEYIKLCIMDTGIGISQEDREHIFEPFFTTKSLGRSGSGLGMSVVWGTVKDHGGYIDIHSRKMEGTTFELYFPRVREDRELSMDDTTQHLRGGKGESILVIDDVQEQRDIATLMLTRLGYEVTSLSSGEAAINYLQENTVDLLVLDMIMHPGIDGLDTYKQIIQIHPGQKAIIVSGFSENEKVAEVQRLGSGMFINKPYTLKDIGTAVRSELDK